MRAVDLFVSDVDGTLVKPDKTLTAASLEAAADLARAGVALSLISSRPPRGMAGLIARLHVAAPWAGFNGGVILDADGAVIVRHDLSAHLCGEVLELIEACGVDAWVFAGDDWLLVDPDADEVWRERRTVEFEPTVVTDLRQRLTAVGKIVAVSDDARRLDACQTRAEAALAGRVSIGRSQTYYLDFSHPKAAKGEAVRVIAERAGVALARTAVIGDMENDLSMFAVAGLAIAMGQAPEAVKRAANKVTTSNSDDGFAAAVRDVILAEAR
jgi:Cof subfamily protein (haloacid dehalogenase superfamily)